MSQFDEFNARVARTRKDADSNVETDRTNRWFRSGATDGGIGWSILDSLARAIGDTFGASVPYLIAGGIGVMGVSAWLGISFWAAAGLCFLVFIVAAAFVAGNL